MGLSLFCQLQWPEHLSYKQTFYVTHCWSRVGNQHSPSPLLGGIYQEGSWQYLLKITHSYSFDPEIRLLGNYPRESNDICTKLCIIAFFRIVKD